MKRAAMILEDWRPVVSDLAAMLEPLGYRPAILPNIIELVGKRVRRDRPELIVVNAESFVIGDRKEWRGMLQGAASILVIPARAPAQLFEDARALRVDSMIEVPVSPPKLTLAIDIAVRNHFASRRLRHEVERLWSLRKRLGDAGDAVSSRRGASAAAVDGTERAPDPRSDPAHHPAAAGEPPSP